jgi:broad-specificity NMP kinase
MNIIIIGCEYVGKTTLANNLVEWGKKRDFYYHLDDHFTIPDSSLPKKDRDIMLTLSPVFKERFQRFQTVYHVRIMNLFRDSLEVGFYFEDTIYGPLYYGYDTQALAIRHGRELEKELPADTILVLLTASTEVIEARMNADPHEYQVIKREDIPVVLEKFKEEFLASGIHAKIEINTDDLTPNQVLDEFIRIARLKFLSHEDMLRLMMKDVR